MNRDLSDVAQLLEHIDISISRINSFTAGMSLEHFLENRLVIDAVLYNLVVIGEAAKKVKAMAPASGLPELGDDFTSAYRIRNVIEHGYMNVDETIIWTTVQMHLPKLLVDVRRLTNVQFSPPIKPS